VALPKSHLAYFQKWTADPKIQMEINSQKANKILKNENKFTPLISKLPYNISM
jgi:hypothetical protein